MYSLLRVSLYLILNSIIGGFTWIYVFTITLVRFKIRSPSDLACILASKKQTFGTKIKIALKKCEKLNIFYKKTITKFVYKKNIPLNIFWSRRETFFPQNVFTLLPPSRPVHSTEIFSYINMYCTAECTKILLPWIQCVRAMVFYTVHFIMA